MADPNPKAGNSNSCAELEQFFELAVDLLSIIGPDGRFQQVNPAFEKRLGWPAQDLAAHSFLDFVHPDDLKAVQSQLERLLHQPQAAQFECRYRCHNDSYRWLSWHLQSTAENQLYGTARDVTDQKWTELSLRENEVKFRSLFERSPDAILLLDGQKFIDCNSAALEMMRCDTKDELLDIHPSELSPERQPDGRLSAEKADEMIAKAFELGTWRFEWVHHRTDGQDFPVEVTLTTVPLADRHVLYTEWREISERKQAEVERTRLSLVLETTSDLVALADPQGELFYINRATRQALGIGQDEDITGKTLADFAPDWVNEFMLKEGLPAAQEQGIWRGETVLLATDGREVLVSQVLMAYKSEQGDVEFFATIARDITEQKRIEESIRQSQQRLSLMVQQTPLAVIEWNQNFEVEDWNPAAEKIFGYPKEEAMGRHVAGLIIPKELKEAIDGVMQDLVKQRGGTRNTNENITKEGQTIVCEWYNTPLIGEGGEVIGVTSLAQDITERIRLEEAIRESLDRRERQVALSTQVAQEIATAPALDELFRQVVELVKDRFDYYHAHLYTLEEEELVMQEGTGEAGRQMKEAGHEIALSAAQSLVARAARSGEPILVPDVSQEPGWLPNPLLPETRAEIAVPIKLGDQLLGVLDIQDEEVGGLGEEDQLLLVGLCGQIAVAINNRRMEAERQQIEETLRLTEISVDQSTDSVFWLAPDARLVFVNEGACQNLGYTKEELTALTVYDIDPSFTPEMWTQAWAALKQNRSMVIETQHQTKDGHVFPVEVRITYVQFQDKEYNFASARDITDRRETEAALAKQATELETVAQVSTQTAGLLDPSEMLQTVVDLSKEGFNLYHAHIYLLNETGDMLDLTAGAGDVGRQMVAEGWRIPLNREHSLVARAARTEQGVISNDVRQEPDFLPNPLLPETRSELAVPIILEDRVLGVLDVQADIPNRFTQEDVRIKTTLAAQVAVALQNARLFERSEQALQELDALTRRLTREGWDDYLSSQSTASLGYVYDLQQLTSLEQADAPETETVEATLTQSLTVQGEPVGLLELAEPQTLTDEAADIVNAVAERLSAHLENLRLTERTERALAETEALYEGSNRLMRASTVDEVLQVVVNSTPLHKFERATLTFFDQEWGDAPPEKFTVAAHWNQEGSQTSPVPVGTELELNQVPFVLLLERNSPTFVQDVATDSRVDQYTAEVLQQVGMRSLVVFPVIVGERWIGILGAEAGQPIELGEDEIRQINSLVDQAATVVQNQRLLEQMQLTLAETETLYNAGRRLNEADGLQEIAAAVAEELNLPVINRGVLMLFNYDSEDQLESVTVRANWYSGQGTPPTPIDTQYSREILGPVFDQLLCSEPLLVDETSDKTAETQNIRSMAVLPLWIGGRQIGVFLLESEETYHFTEQEMRSVTSLAQQMAVAVQNQRLFEQMQATLAEQEKLVALIENSNDYISLATLEGEILYLNEAGRKMSGINSLEEAEGTTVVDFVPEAGRAELMQTVIPVVMEQGQWEGESQLQNLETGEIIDVHMNVFLVRDPQTGVPISMANVARDITERKASEEALLESQLHLSEALNIARLGNWEIDIGSQLFTATDQLYAIYGTTAEQEGGYVLPVEQVGQKFFHPEDAHLVASEIQQAIETDDPNYSSQIQYRGPIRPEEEQSYYLARFRIEKDDQGQTVKITGATQDITEQKQAELERERLLAEVEAAYRQYVRQEWEQFLGEQKDSGWHIEHQQSGLAVEPAVTKSLVEAQEEVVGAGKTKVIAGVRINGHETEAAVVSPISLRGEVIGTLSLQDIDPDRHWTAEEIALVETVTEQLALTVENLRLFDDTQMRASREYLTRQITDKMRQAPDVDAIINTGLSELAKALGVSRTYVKLGSEPKQIDAEVESIRNRLKSNGQSERSLAAPSPPTPGDKAEGHNQAEENN